MSNNCTFQYQTLACSNLIMSRSILIVLCFCFQYCLATRPLTVKQLFQNKLNKSDLKMAVTANGCPFVFDFGQLGDTWYMPHDICLNRRFPPYLDPHAKHPAPSGEVSIELTQFPGMSDTYKVTVAVKNPKATKFRIWDLILWNEEVKEVSPFLAMLMGPNANKKKSAGYFERKDSFQPICCDFIGGPQIRDTIRFTNTQNQRLVDLFVRFAPLTFVGKVQFHTQTDYIVDATSAIYQVPFSTQNQDDLPYDEDWPYYVIIPNSDPSTTSSFVINLEPDPPTLLLTYSLCTLKTFLPA